MKINVKLLIVSFILGLLIGFPKYMELIANIADREGLGIFIFSFFVSQAIYTILIMVVLAVGIWLFKKLGILQPKK